MVVEEEQEEGTDIVQVAIHQVAKMGSSQVQEQNVVVALVEEEVEVGPFLAYLLPLLEV